MAKLEEYSPLKIEIIKRLLQKQAGKGTPMAYEIYVDSFKVVMKTTDLEDFDSYEEALSSETKYLRINLYGSMDDTAQATKYIFEMTTQKPQQMLPVVSDKGLGEIEVGNRIRESIAVERDRWDKEQLAKELEKTRLQLQEAEEYIDRLLADIEKVRTKPNHIGKLDLGMIATIALEGVMRKNPQWFSGIPGLDGIGTPAESPAEKGQDNAEVSFSKHDDKPSLSEDDKQCLLFGQQVRAAFPDDEIRILAKIIHVMAQDKSQMRTVAELLNIDMKKPEAN